MTPSVSSARRRLLQSVLGVAGLSFVGRSRAAPAPRAIRVGAIRWDAWYAPDSPVGRAVEHTLSPGRYHARLPFFATVQGPDRVLIDGAHQSIMDREIHLAAEAGLDFWAFDAYRPDSELSVALRLYLSSPLRSRLNFCLLSGLDLWQYPDTLERHVSLMARPEYQRALGRPLYYLAFLTDDLVERMGGMAAVRGRIAECRRLLESRGVGNPYLVLVDGNAETAARYARSLGADAIGSYGVNLNRHRASFAQSRADDLSAWAAQLGTGMPLVPTLTTGNDRRPRIEDPVFWENQGQPWPSLYRDIYVDAATPRELAEHLEAGLAWVNAHRRAAEAGILLLYAWNENDEGGWLIPTYRFDHSRLDAVRSVLRPRAASKPQTTAASP